MCYYIGIAKARWLCKANRWIAKTPDVAGIGGFLFRLFTEWGLALYAGICGISPVQPFADVVGNHTCCNRDEKCYCKVQQVHLLSGDGADSRQIQTYCSTNEL